MKLLADALDSSKANGVENLLPRLLMRSWICGLTLVPLLKACSLSCAI